MGTHKRRDSKPHSVRRRIVNDGRIGQNLNEHRMVYKKLWWSWQTRQFIKSCDSTVKHDTRSSVISKYKMAGEKAIISCKSQ
jgi:hypothetical protein